MNLSSSMEQVEISRLKVTSQCLLPPIGCGVTPKVQRGDPALTSTYEQDNRGLLAELVRIEQELRETLRREEERQREQDRIRQEENRERWRSLCYLSLNQRTAKPWVTSYYRNIPMHIYCLPIETVAQRQKKKKKKKR